MSSKYDNVKGQEFWAAQTSKSYSKKPKTMFKISFPPSEKIKILNLADISAPGGLSIVLKLPFPMSDAGLSKIVESIEKSGGKVKVEHN